MEDIIKDEFFGEVKYKPNIGSWVGITDAPLYDSEGNTDERYYIKDDELKAFVYETLEKYQKISE